MTVKEIIETATIAEAMRKHTATGASLRTFTAQTSKRNDYNSGI